MPLARIADIAVFETIVSTPIGVLNREQTRWSLGQVFEADRATPGWVLAASLLLIPCTGGFSLLGLLIKDVTLYGAALSVTDGRISYTTTVYAPDHAAFLPIQQAVAWAQQPPPPRHALSS